MFVGLPEHRRPVRTTTGFLVVGRALKWVSFAYFLLAFVVVWGFALLVYLSMLFVDEGWDRDLRVWGVGFGLSFFVLGAPGLGFVVDWILSARFRYLSWVLTTVGAGGWTVFLMLASLLPSDDPTGPGSSGLFRLVLGLTFLFAVLSATATVLLVVDRLKFPAAWRCERDRRRR